jgi:hypothetical protein
MIILIKEHVIWEKSIRVRILVIIKMIEMMGVVMIIEMVVII